MSRFGKNGTLQSCQGGFSFGHGNDCAYYDGYYYVVAGGREESSDDQALIKRYNTSFQLDRQYHCLGDDDEVQYVSGITHLTGDYFILSKGDDGFVCKKYDSSPTGMGGFRIYSSFKLTDPKISNAYGEKYTLANQSIYYDKKDKLVYRIFLKTPLYQCEREDLKLFEVEGMSADSDGKKYISANAAYGSKKEQCDAVFQIELK